MRRTRTGLFALAIAMAGLVSGVTLAQSQNQSGSQSSGTQGHQGTQGQSQQNAPEGFILVQERVVMLTANEPQNHFLRAQQLLSQNDAKAAAAEVNIAAAYLDMQAGRDNKKGDNELSSCADRLRQQASELRKAGGNAQQQQQQLAEEFASANHALAKHFHDLAAKDLGAKKAIAGGYDLAGAADSLAAAYIWSKAQAPKDAVSAIADARRTANELISVEDVAPSGQASAQSQNGSQATDNARTASAKQGSSNGKQSAVSIPADASKVLDNLGKAIQESAASFKAGGQQQKADATKK